MSYLSSHVVKMHSIALYKFCLFVLNPLLFFKRAEALRRTCSRNVVADFFVRPIECFRKALQLASFAFARSYLLHQCNITHSSCLQTNLDTRIDIMFVYHPLACIISKLI